MFSEANAKILIYETEGGCLINIFSDNFEFLKLLSEKLNSVAFIEPPSNFIGTPAITLACKEMQANTACSRRVPRRVAKVVKSKSKVMVGRTRG